MSRDVSVSLNFHEIDTNSQKFYPENLFFQDKGFYTKFFYHKNLEPYGTLVWPDPFLAQSIYRLQYKCLAIPLAMACS